MNRFLSVSILAMLFQAASGFAATPPASSPSGVELKLTQVSPLAGAKTVCIDTPFHLWFNDPPHLAKSGTIQLIDADGAVVDTIDVSKPTAVKTIGGLPNYTYYPVLISGNDVTIAFKNSALSYGKTYELKIPLDLFLDRNGKPFDLQQTRGWRFTTRGEPKPLAGDSPRRVVVAADNSGDFATLQGALDFIPANNNVATTIFVGNGTYNEMVYVTKKNRLTILGESRAGTVLEYPDNQNLNNTDRSAMPGGYRRGMFRAVECNDLVIANMSLHNTTPQGGGQAESLILNQGVGTHAVVTHVDLKSYQDTLQINGAAYVSDCYIEGDVDFMWGTGPVYFENCVCRALRKNAYYTQIRNTAANHGYVYDNCTFDGAPGVTGNFLSRIDPARFPASEVVLLDCMVTEAVGDVAWRFDNFNGAPTPNIHFWEFNSHFPNGKPTENTKRFAPSRRLTEADAETLAHYRDPAWVLGWKPAFAPIILQQPEAFYSGKALKVDAAGLPGPAYQWQREGKDIPGATDASYKPDEPRTYTVVVTNSEGKVVSEPARPMAIP